MRVVRHAVAVAMAACVGGAGLAAEPQEPLQVLFVGNSYTFANDLPGLLVKLFVAGRQRPIVTALEAAGGCTLEQHVRERGAR